MNINELEISDDDFPNFWSDPGKYRIHVVILESLVLSVRYSVCHALLFSSPNIYDSVNPAHHRTKWFTG